jgi:hypothetical protein
MRILFQTQLQRLFRLAHALTLLHIIHADLKLDNFLHRLLVLPDRNGEEIVVTDFGVAGDKWHPNGDGKYSPVMGWSWLANDYGLACPQGDLIVNGFLANPLIRVYFNTWQLSQSLQRDHVAIVDDTRWTPEQKAGIQPIGGGVIAATLFPGLTFPTEVDVLLKTACPFYSGSPARARPPAPPPPVVAAAAAPAFTPFTSVLYAPT